MATLLIRNPQVAARLPPLSAMRCDASATGAFVRDKVGKLVTKRAIDLSCAMLAQSRIQRDDPLMIGRAASRGAQAGIPDHPHDRRKTERLQKATRFGLERGISAALRWFRFRRLSCGAAAKNRAECFREKV